MIILRFLRLCISRGVLLPPVTTTQALKRVEAWLEQPVVSILQPGHQHLAHLKAALAVTSGGALTTDAHLAALAIEYRAELHTNDTDFSRFAGLRWRNPLAAAI